MLILLFGFHLAGWVLLYRAGRHPRTWHFALVALLLASVTTSALLSGWRWPWVPLWMWSLWLAWRVLRNPFVGREPPLKGWRRGTLACGVFISYCTLNLAGLALPSLELPELTGPYPVAKHQWTLPSQRLDVHNPNPFAPRECLVSVYYPTQVNESWLLKRARYLSPAMVTAYLQDEFLYKAHASRPQWLDFFYRREVLALRSQAWDGWGSGLSPALPRYPIVIFSPGYSWFADLHSFYLEQMASYGYIVFALTHPGDSALVEYPDGRRVRWGWSAEAPTENDATRKPREARYEVLRKALEPMLAAKQLPTETQVRELLAYNNFPTKTAPLSVRKDDVIELLDRLETLNAGAPQSQFAGRLDMERIAVTGMSYGGPTASDVCVQDARCKVVVSMDGAEHGRLLRESNTRPALWLEAMESRPINLELQIAYARYAGPAYRVGFEGADHSTFADWPFWPHEVNLQSVILPRWLLDRRRMDEHRALPPLILKYELDFLDHYLKGKPLTLLNGAPTAGVTLERKNIGEAP